MVDLLAGWWAAARAIWRAPILVRAQRAYIALLEEKLLTQCHQTARFKAELVAETVRASQYKTALNKSEDARRSAEARFYREMLDVKNRSVAVVHKSDALRAELKKARQTARDIGFQADSKIKELIEIKVSCMKENITLATENEGLRKRLDDQIVKTKAKPKPKRRAKR